MSPLIQVLLDLLRSLEPAPGTSSEAVRGLLRAHAASFILDDPAAAALPAGDFDPVVVEAIRAGAEQAAALRASRTRLRLVSENLPLGTGAADLAERRSERFGPFVDKVGRLRR